MIALCSKCYFVEEEENGKIKLSAKGMSKKQNRLTWGRYKAALNGNKDLATNMGLRMRDGRMMTYEQQKLGLSAYYDKRHVLLGGIYTDPIEYNLAC